MGFGSNIIAVALGTHFFGIDFLLPILIPLNFITASSIVLRHHRFIDTRILKNRIIPVTVTGLFLGFAIFNYLADSIILKNGFGLFVVGYASIELFKLFYRNRAEPSPLSFYLSAPWLFLGGLIQGIYASGGPMLVIFANRQFSDKQTFRSTLSGTFLLLASILLVLYYFTGRFSLDTLMLIIALLPSLVLGFIVGEWIHLHVNAKIFKVTVFVLLLLSGFSLILEF